MGRVESGLVSFRAYRTDSGELSEEEVAGFARDALGQNLDAAGSYGWTAGNHLLDRRVAEKGFRGGYRYLWLTRIVQKIPPELLRSELAMEVAAASTGGFVSRKDLAECRAAVMERLLPTMPRVPQGIWLLTDDMRSFALSSAMSDGQQDAIEAGFRRSTGRALIAVGPESELGAAGVKLSDLQQARFAEGPPTELFCSQVGAEFLTWLWWRTEEVATSGVALMVEGPLTFASEFCEGSHEVVLKDGMPTVCVEARECLKAGKLVRQYRLMMSREDEMWSGMVDASLGFRGVRLPKYEGLDRETRFQERVAALKVWVETVRGLFREFARVRGGSEWGEVEAAVRAWIATRGWK